MEFYPRYFTGLSNLVTSQFPDYVFLLYGGVKLESKKYKGKRQAEEIMLPFGKNCVFSL